MSDKEHAEHVIEVLGLHKAKRWTQIKPYHVQALCEAYLVEKDYHLRDNACGDSAFDQMKTRAEKAEQNLEAEISTIAEICGEVAKVYFHITNGGISKSNTMADVVIAVHDDICSESIRTAVDAEKEKCLKHEGHEHCVTPCDSIRLQSENHNAWLLEKERAEAAEKKLAELEKAVSEGQTENKIRGDYWKEKYHIEASNLDESASQVSYLKETLKNTEADLASERVISAAIVDECAMRYAAEAQVTSLTEKLEKIESGHGDPSHECGPSKTWRRLADAEALKAQQNAARCKLLVSALHRAGEYIGSGDTKKAWDTIILAV